MSARLDEWWGIGDLDAVFGASDRVVCPWRSASRARERPVYRPEDVRALLAGGPHLVDLDPRDLRCTQTWVLAQHARYYLTGQWERTGTTSADRGAAHNRYPLIHVGQRGQLVILAGHHRSLAALIEGRPVRARVLRPEGSTTVAVLPRLLVGSAEGAGPEPTGIPVAATRTDDPVAATEAILAGDTVLLPSFELAAEILRGLGLDPALVEDRIALATSGRVLLAA